jgi:hypothetical protein
VGANDRQRVGLLGEGFSPRLRASRLKRVVPALPKVRWSLLTSSLHSVPVSAYRIVCLHKYLLTSSATLTYAASATTSETVVCGVLTSPSVVCISVFPDSTTLVERAC